ncbi:MAG: alanine racemase [Treponema sp.]|jgi:alanine racemase|nr:alanine racemase [Treponema sp.]
MASVAYFYPGRYNISMRMTRAIVHLDRLRRNIQAVRGHIGEGPLICMPIKADAYGHGAIPLARAALSAGVRYLAVAALCEGAELREAGIRAPILLLSIPGPEELPEAAALDLIPLVTDRELAGDIARAAAAAGKRLPVHLKVDTGMGRIGCPPGEAADLAAFIAAQPSLEYAGTATHLAVSDSPAAEDVRYTREQLARFGEALAAIRRAGLDPGIVHAANSGAVVFHRDAWFDMVRPGILLYGYPPDAGFPVLPLMELRSGVAFIKRVRPGESISYGRDWRADEETLIATIPAGYGDGLPRGLGGKWSVYIRDRLYPLAGRICMDQCMVNLGRNSDIRRWEEVTIFGGPAPDAGAVASAMNTIPYEITVNISKRVPRVYTKEPQDPAGC